jgi:RNA polymerase sigma factor (sigma-70 family)
MTDKEKIAGLIAHDEQITEHFFFKECRPLFVAILRNVFDYDVDYDECVNELYIYLMEEDARRLRLYDGHSSIYTWLKVVATRFFIDKRRHIVAPTTNQSYDNRLAKEGVDTSTTHASKSDIERLLALMPNRRYVYVIRRLILQDAEPQDVAEELHITVPNLYNIKKRAIASLTEIALNDIRIYEKSRSR